MALRKMLGSAEHPAILRLMRLMETQSKATLTRFACEYASAHYLSIVHELLPEEERLDAAVEAVHAYLDGAPLVSVKAAVKAARAAAQETKDPIAQAAARALSTACAVAATPSCALGFSFYGAAAYAYHGAGVKAPASAHDALATEELERICAALEQVCVPDEANPVKVDWGC